MKKIILVTGAAGFIGSKLCLSLHARGFIVIACDDLSNGKKKNLLNGIKFLKLDISKVDQIKKLPKKVDYIFHLAGQSSGEKSFEDPQNDLKRNFITTYNLIEYSKKNSIKNFFYASSMSVYGNETSRAKVEDNCKPISFYGLHKKLSEDYILKNKKNFNFSIFRMFNVYGPGQNLTDDKQGMVSIYLSSLIRKNRITVKGSLKRFRDLIYIDDVVDIWIEAISNKKFKNKIINLGTGEKSKVSAMLDNLKFLHKKKTSIIIKKGTPGDQQGIFADKSIFKITRKKNFMNMKEGFKKFYSWAKKIDFNE